MSGLWAVRDLLALGLRHPRRLSRLLRTVRPARRLRLALPLALVDPDLVQFEWMPVAASYLSLFDALGCPVVVSCRGTEVNVLPFAGDPRLVTAYPRVFAKAAATHCISEAISVEAARFGMDPTTARVIHPAVDSSFFSPGARREHDLRIISVGSLTWVKGHVDGLEAVSILAREGLPVFYEIVGGDPPSDAGAAGHREPILYLIHALGLEDRVSLTGVLSPAELRDRVRQSNVFLHPSRSDGFGNSVLEGMACGLPVVITETCGAREAIRAGVEGFICPPRRPDALAAAIRTLWNDPRKAQSMGEAGRARTLADYRPAEEIDAFLALYHGVLETRERGGDPTERRCSVE